MQNSKKPQNIAVVGMGVTGISSLYGIYNAIKDLPVRTSNINIDIFDSGFIGGWQYSKGPTSLEHWINMELDAMSVANVNPLEWISKHKGKIKEYLIKNFPNHSLLGQSLDTLDKIEPDSTNVYIPRIVYGLYLKNTYSYTVSALQKCGVTVNKYHDTINDIRLGDIGDNTKYDEVIYTAGHQLRKKTNISDTNIKKIDAYPVSDLQNHLNKLLDLKANDSKAPIVINLKILGTSLSGIDATFTINEWLHDVAINKPELYTRLKVNMTLSSRSLIFPTARVQNMPTREILNDNAMLEVSRHFYHQIAEKQKHLTPKEFEQRVLELYCNIVNQYRTKLAEYYNIELKPLTFQDIFNNRTNRCENADQVCNMVKNSIELSHDDTEYLINQACFRMSSKCGAYLFEKLAQHGLGGEYRTIYLNNVAPVPSQTLKRFINVINHEKIQTNVESALSSVNAENDLIIDATNNVKMVQDYSGPIQSMINRGEIDNRGQSINTGIISAGNNKISTAIVNRSSNEGEKAGILAILNLIYNGGYNEENKRTSWYTPGTQIIRHTLPCEDNKNLTDFNENGSESTKTTKTLYLKSVKPVSRL